MLFVLLLIVSMLLGCITHDPDAAGGDETTVLADPPVDFTPGPLTSAGRRTPLPLSERSEIIDGVEVSFPHACCDGMELLNIAVCTAITDFALRCVEEAGEASALCGIRYEVEYNDRGLLSLKAWAEDAVGGILSLDAFNFDCDTGRRICLSDCFGSLDGSYRFALGDRAAEKLRAQGHQVISFVPPVDDSSLFCITFDGLTLLYRKYELCGAEAGYPEAHFEFNELARYFTEDAIVRRMAYFD